MKLLKKLFYKITNGRPMIYQRDLFWDFIGQEKVKLYTDVFGREWMATTKWSNFRVLREGNNENTRRN